MIFQRFTLRKNIQIDMIEAVLVEAIRDFIPRGICFSRIETINEFVGHAVNGACFLFSFNGTGFVAKTNTAKITSLRSLQNACRVDGNG